MVSPDLPSELEQLTDSETRVDELRLATFAVAIASMQVIRRFQMNGGIIALPDKADGSVLTAVDMESAESATVVLHQYAPGVPILDEELGLSSEFLQNSDFLFLNDPIDGTRPFKAEAPTPTAISSLYDLRGKKLQAATIAEPASGRLWHTDGRRTWQARVDEAGFMIDNTMRRCRVWDGQYDKNGMVLIDNFREFHRPDPKSETGRLILSGANVRNLFSNLNDKIHIQNYGSNGLHHALVANGGDGVAGAITTSMGGEWDVAGVLAVTAAGGVAEGFHVTEERTLKSVDPLNPFDYDMVISANNSRTLDFLRQSLVESVHGQD